MSRLLLNLRHVPNDEAAEVRALLREHGIEFYETQAGAWGISVPGLWVQDADYPQARTCLDRYQKARAERVRAEHAQQRARGEFPTFWSHMRQHPLKVLLSLAGIMLALLLVMWPFYKL